MININNLSIITIFSFLFLLTGCKEDQQIEIDDFNQTELLTNIGNNIIINNYENLNSDFILLDDKKNIFFNSPTVENFDALKSVFIQSYNDFQKVSMFNFGPAYEVLFRSNVNAYPTDTIKIINALNSGSYNLNSITNTDMKGLPALDYLLAGVKQDKYSIIDFYSTDINALNHQKLLSDIITELKSLTSSIYNSWISSGGNYITEFINNTGTSKGTSISLLVNSLNLEYESFLRTAKLSIPLGIIPIEDNNLKYYCEAYYSGISIELITSDLEAIKSVYTGMESIGLDDYLKSLDETSLSNTITVQFNSAINAVNDIPGPLSVSITRDQEITMIAYQEIQKNVPYLKIQLPIVIGVELGYTDSDGD